jgi:hypothetical protein
VSQIAIGNVQSTQGKVVVLSNEQGGNVATDGPKYMESELHVSPEQQEFGNKRRFKTTPTQLQLKDMKYICMCVRTMAWRGQDAIGAGGLPEGAVGRG